MKKKVLRGLLPVVLAAAWLTGCGGEGDIGTQETQTPAADEAMSAEEDAAEADGEAASGGDFLVGFANNSDTYLLREVPLLFEGGDGSEGHPDHGYGCGG